MIRARASKANTQKWYASTSALLNRSIPTLYHDFAKQRYYDSALGKTGLPYTAVIRASNAMQFDAQGRLVWAPANLLLRSENLSLSWLLTDTTLSTDGTLSPSGSLATLCTQGTAGTATVVQVVASLVANASYTESIFFKPGTAVWIRLRMVGVGGTSNVWLNLATGTKGTTTFTGTDIIGHSNIVALPNGWYRADLSATNPTDTSRNVEFLAVTGNGLGTRENGATYYFGGAQLEPTGPDSPKAYNVTTSSAYYGPRFDYDPFTKEPLGILVEDQRTNDIANSFMLNSGLGTFQAGTGSNGPTYLGGWPSARYTGDGVSTPHFYFGGSVTPGASTSRSISAIVGYVDTQYLQLATSANWVLDSANTYMNIDASAGTITASGSAVTNPYIRKLGDNVYQIGFTCVTAAVPTGGAGAIVGAANSPTAGRLPIFSHTGSFDVIYLSNCAGVGWESITPSYATVSTRASDTYKMLTGSWLNTSRGTVYVEARKVTVVGGAYTFTNIGSDAGTSERNQFRISSSNTSHIVTVGGVVQATSAVGTAVAIGTTFKAAYRYIAGTQKLFEDGTAGVAGTVPALPATQDTLHTGQLGTASEKFNGWIKEVRYYNNASASDAQIQAITT